MKKNIWIIVGLVGALTVVLATWFDEVVEIVVIKPIAYLTFVFQMMFGSFHQGLIWGAFILIACIIPILSLASHMAPASGKKHEEWDYPDRVYVWGRHIRAIYKGKYLRISLEDHLADLILETISLREGTKVDDILQQFRSGNLNVPPEVHNLLVAGYQPSLMDEKTKYQYHPEEIVQFLETQMETSRSN